MKPWSLKRDHRRLLRDHHMQTRLRHCHCRGQGAGSALLGSQRRVREAAGQLEDQGQGQRRGQKRGRP